MNTYSMTCPCGDMVQVKAGSREEAVTKMQAMMSEDAIKTHMAEKHPGEPAITKVQVNAGIAEKLQQVS